MPWRENTCGIRDRGPRILDLRAKKPPISNYPPTIPPTILSLSCQNWSQLSDSAYLDRVNSAKIPLFYGLVKHFSRTPPDSSCTPNLLAILLAIGYCERN